MVLKKRQSMIQLVTMVMLVILAALCSGCESKGTSSEYKIVDSGIWTYLGLDQTVWLDNDRILFESNKTLKPGGGAAHLTVWNITTGKIESSHKARLVCARNGNVVTVERDEMSRPTKFYRGTLENLIEHPMPHSEMMIDSLFDCDWVPKATWGVVPPSYPYTRKLHGDNHFVTVDRETRTSNGRAIYYEKSGSEGIELPIYLLSYRISYSEFLDAYMVDNGIYDPANSEKGGFKVLERNGNLRDVQMPKSMLIGKQYIYPLKNGYLSEYRDGKHLTGNPFDCGLLLLQGEKVTRLIVGSIHGVSISPDGCKAAFIHSRDSNEYFSQKKPYRTVKFINFCKGETKP
ncbi:MAG: hypothetical protein M0023_08660 [Desulfobacteraceae bacterium]|nr:hypothetical protein [Desulfobacteraceae bacterium]